MGVNDMCEYEYYQPLQVQILEDFEEIQNQWDHAIRQDYIYQISNQEGV